MLPGLLMVLHRIYDFTVELLENSNLTFQFKGPLLTGMDMLVTVDPADIHYILSSNFLNYAKGPEFKEVFDVYKDVIFNVDSQPWEHFRKTAQVILNHQRKILNLQDVFQRFTFDISMVLIDGSDPTSLSIEMPENEFAKAPTVAGEGTMHRHIKPRFLWKLQRWMGLETTKYEILNPSDHDRFPKDVILTYISGGRDTITSALTWFSWLLSENPDVVAKITSPKLARRSDLLIPMSSTSWCTCMALCSLRHEPTFKFLVFNTGPRNYLGKQLTMNLMKTVIVEILQNYEYSSHRGSEGRATPWYCPSHEAGA
ncbi:hypothetical protein Bca52824_068438 [Brassica carinata]|uniref:Cytochrome P450 n=1 Tax=Brassica carinata TaxID=52824 RepID=A0A8X7U187_BRACI|nr:hypothetical protein Bca52824_068438 [Brassica carinata]